MPKLYWEKKDEKPTQYSNYSQNSYEFQVLELIQYPIISSIVFDNDIPKNKRLSNQKQEKGSGGWNNLLIWGENKRIMESLSPKFSNKINLIYIDPPYATGSNFDSKTFIGESNSFESKKAYLAHVRKFFDVGDNAFTLLNRAAGLKQLNSIDDIFRPLIKSLSKARAGGSGKIG